MQQNTGEDSAESYLWSQFRVAHDERLLQLAGPVKREMPADLPAERPANEQFAPTLPALRHNSLTEKIRRVHSLKRGEKRAIQIPNVPPM